MVIPFIEGDEPDLSGIPSAGGGVPSSVGSDQMTSNMEAPAMEAPAMEAPAMEAPAMEAPLSEAPAMEAPLSEAPAMESEIPEAPVDFDFSNPITSGEEIVVGAEDGYIIQDAEGNWSFSGDNVASDDDILLQSGDNPFAGGELPIGGDDGLLSGGDAGSNPISTGEWDGIVVESGDISQLVEDFASQQQSIIESFAQGTGSSDAMTNISSNFEDFVTTTQRSSI